MGLNDPFFMILYSQLYQREGNDTWLRDLVELHWNGLGLFLDIKKRWSGWGGDMLENHTLDLNEGTIEQKQKCIDEYLKLHDLEHVVKIPLMELMPY